jgi:flagellar motor protein MotB
MGGYDIFLSKQNANGSWEVPRNIGYPINSESDDIGFFVSTDGKTGYFASNKLQGKGGWDVYSFFLYPEARPDKVLFVKGQLKDEASGKPAQGRVEFKNLSNQRVHRVEVDSATGSYVSALRFDTDYTMTIKKEGYAPVSRFISKDDPHYALPVKEDVSLKQLEVGGVYVMDNIHFQTNSYVLSDTAKALLDDFTVFLTENPGVRISVNGHTDDVNDAESNRILSENRAREVFLYLTLRGISKSRLAYAGFGESRPVSSNATPEGRAKNRRTEFVILSR